MNWLTGLIIIGSIGLIECVVRYMTFGSDAKVGTN